MLEKGSYDVNSGNVYSVPGISWLIGLPNIFDMIKIMHIIGQILS